MKKSKTLLWDKPHLAYKYRWEFIRRNNEYQRDYNNFLKAGSKKRITNKIFQKYGILPVDYNKSYDELVKIVSKISMHKKKLSHAEDDALAFTALDSRVGLIVNEDSCSEDSLSVLVNELRRIRFKPIPFHDKKKLYKMRTLRLSLNMNYSKEQLLYEIDKIIDHYKWFRNKNSRMRFEQYDQYLKIYDLFNKGWSWKRLATKFYSNDTGGFSYAKRKTKRDYERAKQFVGGLYRQIR